MNKYEQAFNLIQEHGSIRAAAEASGIPSSTLFDRNKIWVREKQDEAPVIPSVGDTIKQDFKADSGTLTTKSTNIKTPEEALAKAGIDTDIWMIDRQTVSSWEMASKDENGNTVQIPLWAVKLWLKRRQPEEIDDFQEAFDAQIERLKTVAPVYPELKFTNGKDEESYMYMMSLADSHIGKLAHKLTSSGDEYTTEIACERFESAVVDLMYMVKDKTIDKIVLPTMGDFFHINSSAKQTSKGTSVETDGEFFQHFIAGMEVFCKVVDFLQTKAPEIEIVCVPGNHDKDMCFFMAQYLNAYYRNTEAVIINQGLSKRSYTQYYKNLLMFIHGDSKQDRLPMVMAREKQQEWSECDYFDIYTGHYHKKMQTKYTSGDTHNGVTVNTLASLSGTDRWHDENGFVKGNKLAEGILYSKFGGSVASFYSRI